MSTNANMRQVGGKHYGGGALQHWDYTVRCLNNRYLEGQITKYVARHAEKNKGEDVQKAMHYLQKLREEFLAGRVEPEANPVMGGVFMNFVKDMPGEEQEVMRLAATWMSTAALDRIHQLLLKIEGRYRPRGG